MPKPNDISPAALAALAYVTVGSLTVVWSAVGGVYVQNNPQLQNLGVYCVGVGTMASGVALVVIGLAVGWIGGAARHADRQSAVVVPGLAVQPPHIGTMTATPAAAPPGQSGAAAGPPLT